MLPLTTAFVALTTTMTLAAQIDTAQQDSTRSTSKDPFAVESTYPFGAVPFDKIGAWHFPAAFDRAMATQREAVRRITLHRAVPNLQNVLEPLGFTSIPRALTNQLGLALVESEAPYDVIVIDEAHRP